VYRIPLGALLISALLGASPASRAQTSAGEDHGNAPSPLFPPCSERPGGNALRFVCPLPSFLPEGDDETLPLNAVRIVLVLAEGTPLRIAIDERTRISHLGEPIHGHVVDTVYAFDEPVIPAGSVATGRVTEIDPVSKLRWVESYANGNFSPFHRYQVTFDRVILPNGRELLIDTTVPPGAAEVVHLVSKAGKSQDGANEPEARDEIRPPRTMQRLKQFLLGQSPYRRQYLTTGTRFSASLNRELDFGSVTQMREQLAVLGDVPPADTVLHARLVLEVSSATASRGNPVLAELTRPLYSGDHRLLLPSGSRLIGRVLEVKPARHLHRNGELRLIFEYIELPGGGLQPVLGSLEGLEIDRAAHLKLDEEGGAHATDSKTRYLSTGVAILLAAAAAHPDVGRDGTVDPAGDPAVRAGAGASGFGLAGTLIGLAAKSNVVSIIFSAYGASASIYTNFLSRGREVVLPKNASLEIGFGTSHPSANPP